MQVRLRGGGSIPRCPKCGDKHAVKVIDGTMVCLGCGSILERAKPTIAASYTRPTYVRDGWGLVAGCKPAFGWAGAI